MTEPVEIIQFPEPRRPRINRRRASYAVRPSPHAHWAWIMPLYFGLIAVGVVIALKAPAFFLPYCWVSGFAFTMVSLYGVVRSALKG